MSIFFRPLVSAKCLYAVVVVVVDAGSKVAAAAVELCGRGLAARLSIDVAAIGHPGLAGGGGRGGGALRVAARVGPDFAPTFGGIMSAIGRHHITCEAFLSYLGREQDVWVM